MQVNGKLVTIAILTVALAAAAFAWWFQFTRGRRALEYWGGERAAVIRHGDNAELAPLLLPESEPSPLGSSVLTIDGMQYGVGDKVPLDRAPGFIHARHALIDDGSYQWEKSPPTSRVWTHALTFSDDAHRTVTVVVSLESGVLRPLDSERTLVMSAKLQQGLGKFFAEHLNEPAAEPPSRSDAEEIRP